MPHMRFAPRIHRMVLVAGLALSAAALACGAGVPGANSTATPAIDLQATAAALQATVDALAQAQTQQAQIPPTAPALPTAADTAEPTETGAPTGASVFEDFATDDGKFETWDGAQVTDGEFYLGQFTDCGDLAADAPFGCLSTCLACGVASDYEMTVDVRYVDGISERTYGLVLQFNDVNGNGIVDSEDFYVEFQISAFTAYYIQTVQVRTHFAGDPVGAASWLQLWYVAKDFTNSGYGTNTLDAIASKSGTSFDLYVNGNYLKTVTIPDTDHSEGRVGVSLSGRRVQVAFDNFNFTPK